MSAGARITFDTAAEPAPAHRLRILVAHNVPLARNGGMSRLMGFIHDEVVARGHTVDYFCSDHFRSRLPAKLARFTFPWAAFRHARRAALDGTPYDIINVHEPSSAAVVSGRRMLGGARVVVTSHGLERRAWQIQLEEHRLGRDRMRLKTRVVYPATSLWQSDVGLRGAHHIFCTSFEDRDYVIRRYQRAEGDITRVFSAASGIFAAAAEGRDYQRRPTRLLFSGTWLHRKGISDLATAFASLKRAHPELELHVLGTGVPDQIVRLAFPAEVRGSVLNTRSANDPESVAALAAAYIYVFPSLFESTPLTLMEAMAAGLPIVTTATCGMKEVINDGENGCLVPIRSPERIRTAIETLLGDESLRERLGRAASAQAREKYTWKNSAAPVISAYENLKTAPAAAIAH